MDWDKVRDERGWLMIGFAPGKYVQIGEDIFLYMKKMTGKSGSSRYRLGIKAPKDKKITMLRAEEPDREDYQ